ncbi:SDR family oxidoreductase [Sporocytophaga myxococcoides]|uniref:SDR family oxidoreductase n=1 Tax=Sporocytophaga myxococcoides TaxID=153721 RepID=UPI000415668A|nr:SDR family oxidoreductase [Sporocytophaga myxococcoides]
MKGKVVIITGGSSGIGKACAEEFGNKGAKIVITGRNRVNLDETALLLKSKGITVLAIQADSAKEEDNEMLVNETIKAFGRIDILINNAGISMRALFTDADLGVLKKVMDINFYGTVYATKYALPEIIKNKGSVVGVSSIAGSVGLPGRTGYSASKFAMNGFLEALRIELLCKNVHVLVACPGFTTSNIRNTSLSKDGSIIGESSMDEGKMMSAEEVALNIYKAVEQRKRDLVLTSQGKSTIFLKKFFPSLVDRVVFNHISKEKDSPLK